MEKDLVSIRVERSLPSVSQSVFSCARKTDDTLHGMHGVEPPRGDAAKLTSSIIVWYFFGKACRHAKLIKIGKKNGAGRITNNDEKKGVEIDRD